MFARLTTDLAVNPALVKSVSVHNYNLPDKRKGDLVVLLFDNSPRMVLPETLDFDTVVHALQFGCHYHKVYLDQAGDVDICIQHQEISDKPYNGNAKDRFRQCNAVSLEHLLRKETR